MRTSGVFEQIENRAEKKIVDCKSVSGGCISKTEKLQFEDGSSCFLKTGAKEPDMFLKEANGLKEIQKSGCIRVPDVLLVNSDFLLLEYIEQGLKGKDFFSRFGVQFANLHLKISDQFGFKEDNYIGATPQLNIPDQFEAEKWSDFYYNKRLLYQYKLAEQNNLTGEELKKGFLLLENRIEEILAGSEEEPSLLHGDLWGGNYLCDTNSNPVLIDPAVYYGHREADLAMTKLFGGFTREFYTTYAEANPLPQEHAYRENIYLLYHVLNHLNLFGSSYYGQAVRLVWYYLH